VVQYGVGTFFARNLFFVLDWLYKLVGNWGVAIILLVVLVRLVLFPLTYKGMVSMYKLKELAPKMKELQQKYKKDPQKLQMHMMKLYKEHDTAQTRLAVVCRYYCKFLSFTEFTSFFYIQSN